MNINELKFKKYPVLDQGFICLVDAMGDDAAICQAARVSYGNDNLAEQMSESKDRNLIRYLMSHQHTTPFEMVEIKFMVQAPMDCWRQWIRHRTANVNEYSTRYTEAIDACQTTAPDQWRLQATDNKQGSSGFLTDWPKEWGTVQFCPTDKTVAFRDDEVRYSAGDCLTIYEKRFHEAAQQLYQQRLSAGVAKEQARKDLPLSTYTRAYWKCDLHNIFNFLRLRMDSHAQLEIRSYANAMYEIVKQIVPVACEAFEDYVLNAKKFSAMEMNVIRYFLQEQGDHQINLAFEGSNLTARELAEFKKKVGI